MSPAKNELTEEEVRTLRDQVYGPQTDHEWELSKKHWMTPDSIEWLKERADRPISI